MDPNQSAAEDSGPSLKDPELVTKLVEELKSQGIFDQIRSDCLAEVDTKPAYQNLRTRVEGSVERYLNKQQHNFKPNANSKIQMRNMLRKHIQDSNYLGSGTQGIVDQVVGPKIMTTIEPEMEAIMYKMFGIEKPDSNDEEEDGQNGAATEKLSNISSSDAEMPSAAESDHEEGSTKNKEEHETDASSPGPGLRGDISPLTPDRKSDEVEAPRGDVSPLTPPPPGTGEPIDLPPPPGTGEPVDLPPRTPSPRTPPLPPPMRSEVMEQQVVEEEVIAQDSMSPVSDGDLADISPPKGSPETPDDSGMPSPPQVPQLPPPLPSGSSTETPPLPAPPPPPPPKMSQVNRPPSPLTSPIESSSSADESEQKRQVSASDISDAELPATASSGKDSSDDLEELEKAKAALEAQLAAANISDEASTSEGEPIAEQKTEAENSSSAKEEDEEEKMSSQDDDHEQVKRKPSKSSEDEDGDNGSKNDPNPNVGHPPPQPDSTTGSVETKSTDEKATSSKETSSSKERRSSKDHHEKSHRHRDHHDRHHHGHGHHHKKSHKKDRDRDRDRDREKYKNKSEKSDKERSSDHKSHDDKNKERHGNGSTSSSSSTKDKNSLSKSAKFERQSSKVDEIEAKIREKSIKSFKSDKLNSFDMFAPKAPKPKLVMPKPMESPKPTPSTPIINNSLPKSSSDTTVKPKTPKLTVLQRYDQLKKEQKEKIKAEKAAKAAANSPKVEKKDSFIVHSESPRSIKSYPGFPLTETHVDKEKQHELDRQETKRRLEERRERLKLEEKQKKELKKKQNKNRNSSGSSSSPTKYPHETKDNSSASEKDDVKRYENKRGDDDSGSDIEYQRRPVIHKDRKRKRYQSSSDEELGVVEVKGEKPIISTRKSQQKQKADEILNDPDPDFSANHGWTSDELNAVDVTKSEALKKYLAVAQVDISSVEVPKITDAELDDIEQYIYFEAGNDYPEGNAKLVEVLKKIGKDAGVKRAPKLVPKCPPEIQEKLDHFGFKRHQVEIITDPSKIRKKRIYTEVEYCHKLGKPPMKKSRVIFIEEPALDVPPVETIPEPEIDDIEAQLAKMDSQDSSEEESASVEKKNIPEWSDNDPFYGFEPDENYSNKIIKPSGSIFGIDLDIYESVEDENVIPESNGLKVIFSNAMLTHCKKRLSKDKEAMAELNKIRGMKPSQIKALQKNKPATVKEETNDVVEEVKGPGDYPMPPSPESNTPSDDSNEEKGSVSPIIGSTNINSVEKIASPQRRQARRAK